jgi:MFS family permease
MTMLALIPFSIPVAWCIDNIGLKWGAGIGVILTGVCGFLRIFAPNYTWMLVCMIGCAIAQPYVLNAFIRIASNWFPEKEEVRASGLFTMSLFIGLATVMFATDFILAHYREVGTVKQGIDAILLTLGRHLVRLQSIKGRPHASWPHRNCFMSINRRLIV